MARFATPAILIGVLTGIANPAHAGTNFVGGGISITTSNRAALGSASIGFCGWPGLWNGIGIWNGPWWPSYQTFWRNGTLYWVGPFSNGLPVIDAVRREDPELMRVITGPTMPEPDPALVDLHAGRYTDAAKQFLHRANQREGEEAKAEGAGGVAIPDRSALRLHALALAGAGDMAGAARAFAEAHAEDPLLGSDPIMGSDVLRSTAEVRRIVLDGIEFANRTDRSESWALVGYLLQVQGRYDEARAMLDRARATVDP